MAGRLVVSGATGSLLERTGLLSVDVGPDRDRLIAALAPRALAASVVNGLVEVQVDGDGRLDIVRDVVAELGLPLNRMTIRLTSLDEVFVTRSNQGSLA